ncbi:hypothetical protein MPRS_15590 [Mycobacterium paraseoulense]|nr:hypothetical protein MPRS_15590 [Mycobacterium paraseoulense]
MHMVISTQRVLTGQKLVEARQGAALVPGDESSDVAAGAAVTFTLLDQLSSNRLNAGQHNRSRRRPVTRREAVGDRHRLRRLQFCHSFHTVQDRVTFVYGIQ